MKQIDRYDLGGHDLAEGDDLVVVLVVGTCGIEGYLALQAYIDAGLQTKFAHDSYVAVDDSDPLLHGLVLMTGHEMIHDALQGVGSLAHGGDNDHEVACALEANDMLQVADACCIPNRSSSEFVDFHNGYGLWVTG